MDFYRVLEDYSVEALLNYEDSASEYFPIIDDNGILAFLADAREGVVVGTLSVQVPKLSPKLVYLLTRMSTQALDYDNHIITSGGETDDIVKNS